MDFSNAEIFLNIKISPYLYSALAGACSESIGQGKEKRNRENLGQTVRHNLKRGGVMEMKIVNHIKIDGQEYLFEELSAERKKDIAGLIQENAMKAAGYCKVTRKEAAG